MHHIAELTSFDVYRDGGSISASYLADDDVEYTLFFKIDRSAGEVVDKKKKYKFASLEKHKKVDYVSPVTGVSTPDWKTETKEIGWDIARQILKEMKPLQKSFSTDYEWVFGNMVKVANSEDHSIDNS